MTSFQELCYQKLTKHVPAGKVISYKNLAILIGKPNAYRAIGNAMNKNPFAPKVPCHRVIKSNGHVGGYINGSKIKISLLKKEGVDINDNGFVTNLENILSNV